MSQQETVADIRNEILEMTPDLEPRDGPDKFKDEELEAIADYHNINLYHSGKRSQYLLSLSEYLFVPFDEDKVRSRRRLRRAQLTELRRKY